MTLHRKALDVSVQTDATASLIYVVDDDPLLSDLVAANLVVRGYRVVQFGNGEAFLDSLDLDPIFFDFRHCNHLTAIFARGESA